MDIREKIKLILHTAGWSQEELARQLGISFKTLNSWATGKSSPRSTHRESIDQLFLSIVGRPAISKTNLKNLENKALSTHLDLRELLHNEELLNLTTLYLTYHTNTIEGSTMTMNDVATVLADENAIIRNKSYREQAEARNHRAAFLFLLDQLRVQGNNFQWSTKLILEVHQRLMNSLMDDAGTFRHYGVRVMGSHVARANCLSIPQKIHDLTTYMNTPTDNIITKLAQTHAIFELIHPFGDGNGRIGRLIMFTQALQHGLVPPLILKERKRAYYTYLEIANKTNDYDLLSMFIAESILSTNELLR